MSHGSFCFKNLKSRYVKTLHFLILDVANSQVTTGKFGAEKSLLLKNFRLIKIRLLT